MRIHHLNCGTLRPLFRRWIHGSGPLFARGHMVSHCLLIESRTGLTLIDTGFGVRDVENPRERYEWTYRLLIHPSFAADETAVAQVRKLGFRPEDVRHIVVTHLDHDHAGGITDFPGAEVHVAAEELEAAIARSRPMDRRRYAADIGSWNTRWIPYERGRDRWFGFEGAQEIRELGPDFLLIPLPGHSRGHCGVAARCGDGWLLHVGDAYFHPGDCARPPQGPRVLSWFQRKVAARNRTRMETRQALGKLRADPQSRVTMFCSHDEPEFQEFARS